MAVSSPPSPTGGFASPIADAEQLRARLAAAPRRSVFWRRVWEWVFLAVCGVAIVGTIGALAVLIGQVVWTGARALDWGFLTRPSGSDNPAEVGVLNSMVGSFLVTILCAILTLPIGVATAVFLEEFKPRNRLLRGVQNLINLNITNLAGIPSIVYGIIGLSMFVFMFGLFGAVDRPAVEIGNPWVYQTATVSFPPRSVRLQPEADGKPPALVDGMIVMMGADDALTEIQVIGPDDPIPSSRALARRTIRSSDLPARLDRPRWYYLRLPLGRGLLTGALTLMLVVLPMVIIASQEAIRAVPDSLREAAYGIGATKWQTIRQIVLPSALPGILTGTILAMSRALGEAAPLLVVVATASISHLPSHLLDKFTILPLSIFHWTERANSREFETVAAGAIIVLLVILLTINSFAIALRIWARRSR